jgi:hypothetical protein
MSVVAALIDSHKVEQQAYRACMGLLRLGDRYGMARLESACKLALGFTPRPSFRIVKDILATGQDEVTGCGKKAPPSSGYGGFTRGEAYYGGDINDK